MHGSTNDETQRQNMEDLAQRILALERWVSCQEGEIRGLKGRIEELERR